MTFSHDKGRNARAHAVQALRSGGSLAKPIGKKYDRSIVMPIYLVLLVIFFGHKGFPTGCVFPIRSRLWNRTAPLQKRSAAPIGSEWSIIRSVQLLNNLISTLNPNLK